MRHHQTTTTRTRAAELLAAVETTLDDLLGDEAAHWRASDPQVADVVDVLRHFVTNGGKRLRPAFCIWGYLGAIDAAPVPSTPARIPPTDDDVISVATALELLHAFALVHDDVMDGSATRRGAPTVHERFMARHVDRRSAGERRRFGEGLAILVGDLAHTLAERTLALAAAPVRVTWHEMQLELIRGQALDMVAAADGERDAGIARRIAVLKSGRYTIARPLVLGALAAGRADLATAYTAFGDPLGEAFQLRDDLMGAFGETHTIGKPVGDDLREGKPTLLLACAHERVVGRDVSLLRRAGADDLTDDEVRALQDLLVGCGARDEIERRLDVLTASALDALDHAPISLEARAGLRELAVAAVWRQA